MVQNVFILLLGFPGVGKLTIAQKLSEVFPARIIDNHWINNPILALLDNDGQSRLPDAIWEQTAKVRDAVLSTIVRFCDPSANFILTSAGVEDHAKSLESYQQVKNAADQRGALFVPVRLLCNENELVRRVASPSRLQRLKSVDIEDARRRSRTATVLNPSHENVLSIDVTRISTQDSAKIIHAHVLGVGSG
ncbi:chloramphenicol phosphotransferase [Brucella tritici]|uniref:chloramphenicol phosphotransferase n=1 Tax=Brucella tritici TaxID=94626 RepID=UPI003D6D22BE